MRVSYQGMTDLTTTVGEQVTDLTLPGGCILCGGDLPVRVTSEGAASCCKACRWIARPRVVFTKEGIQVAYQPAGQA